MRHHQSDIVADGGSAVLVTEEPDESATEAIVRGIAALEGVPASELDVLYEHIESEALNELMTHSSRYGCNVTVEFTYEGYTVRVDGEDDITITHPPDA